MGRLPEQELIAVRDSVVRELRRLAGSAPDALPDDKPLKGILGRSESLLEAQARHIDALAEVDLLASGPGSQERVLEALTRALHVPRIVVALGEVLRQDAKSDALRPAQHDAARVAARIQHLARLWHVFHAADLPQDDGEDVVEDL